LCPPGPESAGQDLPYGRPAGPGRSRQALEPLCRFIESRVNVLFNENAMSALGAIGDERAVPTLVGVLLDVSSPFEQSFSSAAITLSRCGPKGFEALVSVLDHADPRVRLAAVVGVDCSGDPRATEILECMKADPDAKVRERARHRRRKLIP
jgi:HEAT repeat protein